MVAKARVGFLSGLLASRFRLSVGTPLLEAGGSASKTAEINAGRVQRSLGRVHPNMEALSHFRDHDVAFVLGTDSHRPDELSRRVPELRAVADDAAVELVDIDDVLA